MSPWGRQACPNTIPRRPIARPGAARPRWRGCLPHGAVDCEGEPLVAVDGKPLAPACVHVRAAHERLFRLVHGRAVEVVAHESQAGRAVLVLVTFVLLFQLFHGHAPCGGNLLPTAAVCRVVVVGDAQPTDEGVLVGLELVVELEQVAVTRRARRGDADGEGVPDLGLASRFPPSKRPRLATRGFRHR